MTTISVKYCVIGGTGRSGTTILSKVFSEHPAIAQIPELRFSIDPDGIIDFYIGALQCWSPYHCDLRLRRLEALLRRIGKDGPLDMAYTLLSLTGLERLFSRKLRPAYHGYSARQCCPGYRGLVNELVEKLTAFSFAGHWTGAPFAQTASMHYCGKPEKTELARILGDFLRRFAERVVEAQGLTAFLEKNTWNILWFDRLLELVPEAKMIHVYRDPRDVVASYMTQDWMPSDAVQGATVYRDLIKRWTEVRNGLPDGSYREIALEEITAAPESSLRQLCDFWGLDWSDRLLEVDLSRSNAGRWKQSIPAVQQDEVQDILAPALTQLGYE